MEENISSDTAAIPNQTGDVSNKTIVVLVILTVLISVLGTLTVLREVSDMEAKAFRSVPRSGSSTGQVSLTIAGETPEQPAPAPALTAGYVTLNILP